MGLTVIGCGRVPRPDEAARVNGESIPRKVFDARLKVRLESLRTGLGQEAPADQRARLRREVLDELIARQLMVQAARRGGERVSKEEVDAAMETLRGDILMARQPAGSQSAGNVYPPAQQVAAERDGLAEALRQRGISMAELRADVEANLLARRFAAKLAADVSADEAEARRYYEAHSPKFNRPAQYRLRVIATANERQANAIAADIRSGKTTFAREAEVRAAGILQAVRGEMGWVELATLPPEMARVVATLRPGEVGGPVAGEDSVYLVQMVEKKAPSVTPFEKIKTDLVHVVRQEKRAAKLRDWIARERAAARIVVAEELR